MAQTDMKSSEKRIAVNRHLMTRVVIIISLVIIAAFLASPPWSILDKADLVGYAICHRLPERSFHLGGRQLPLCARCSGTFLGALLGLATLWLRGRRRAGALPPTGVLIILAGFIALMGIDGLNSYMTLFPNAPHLYEPSNILRLTTGTLNGLAQSAIVYPIFSFTLWREAGPQRSIQGFRELAILLALDALLVLIIQAQIDFLLYPLAILSVLGVLIMLTLINTMIVLIIIRRESMATTWHEALIPLLLGLVATSFEIGIMDLMRILLTQRMNLPL